MLCRVVVQLNLSLWPEPEKVTDKEVALLLCAFWCIGRYHLAEVLGRAAPNHTMQDGWDEVINW